MILQFKTIKNEAFKIECEPSWTVFLNKTDWIIERGNLKIKRS